MRPLQIAFPLHVLHGHGGIERHTIELVRDFARSEHITILSSRHLIDPAQLGSNVTMTSVPMIPRAPRTLSIPLFAWAATARLRREHYDVVVNNGCGACFEHDVIIAQSVHQSWVRTTFQVDGRRRPLLNPLHYWTLAIERSNYRNRRFRRVIAISNAVRDMLISEFDVPAERIVVIHHGVNTEEFAPEATTRRVVRARLGLDESEIVWLFVGHEFRRKGLSTVLEALQRLPTAHRLLVVGGGEHALAKGWARARNVQSRVTFVGASAHVAQYYQAADAFVFPSSFDAFGLVVLEAMSAGLPAVVSAQTGASELITHGNDGFVLAHWHDASTLAKHMLYMAGVSERARMSRAARATAERNTWATCAERTLAVLREAALEKLSAPAAVPSWRVR